MDISQEPVRGGYPPDGFYRLPGIDRARARAQGLIPRSPADRLFGTRLTHASVGSATVVMPASPWLAKGVQWTSEALPALEIIPLVTTALAGVAQTTSPPGTSNAVHVMDLNFIRRPTVASESFVARARSVATGPSRVTAEVHVEDAEGRLVVYATGQVTNGPSALVPADGPVPTLAPIAEPSYPTPDPPARPVDVHGVPIVGLLDIEWTESDPGGAATLSCRPNEWMNSSLRIISPAVLFTLLSCALYGAEGQLAFAAGKFGNVEHNAHFVFNVGNTMRRPRLGKFAAHAKVTNRNEEAVYTTGELTSEDGRALIMGTTSSTIVALPDSGSEVSRDRVLAAVLYTDIVGSTPHVERMGDARWKDLIEKFREQTAKHVLTFRGREVKWTGDGVLATFDSPARAVQCARAIRDAGGLFNIEVRAGVHVGECELMGTDVAGIAVHVAQRVMDSAAPGTILVTSTVREAAAGSGLRFADKGRHSLKGVEGDWQLFGVDD